MHLLIDGQVCVPQMAWLNPGLRHHLPGLTKLAQLVEASGNGVLPAKLDKVERAALEWLRNQCVLAHGVGYVLPMFSEEYCDKLVLEAQDMARAVGYEPNPDEEEAYQIPELVLAEVCPSLFAALDVFKSRVLDVYSVLLFGARPEVTRSIQFAQYSPDQTSHGNWHKDIDSDVTAVVSLQPERYEGGGTDLRLNAWDSIHVPPAPKGYILFFNGKHTLHRGCRVTKGRRDLLVFWTEYK